MAPEDVANLICGTEEETSVRVLCECKALFSTVHIRVPSFLYPEDVTKLSMGAIWNFGKGPGLL